MRIIKKKRNPWLERIDHPENLEDIVGLKVNVAFKYGIVYGILHNIDNIYYISKTNSVNLNSSDIFRFKSKDVKSIAFGKSKSIWIELL